VTLAETINSLIIKFGDSYNNNNNNNNNNEEELDIRDTWMTSCAL